MSQMMSQDTRFATLLNPIRDLAMNWDVDISSTLEEYLEELDNIRIPKESLGSMNFAEAALLVQGSAVVYCKKVEHLHKLVHQALELVYGQASEKMAAAAGGDVSVAPEDDALLWGEDEKYLLLDDVIDEAENIDIPILDDAKTTAKSRMSISSATSHQSALLMTSLLNNTFEGKNKLRLSTGSIDASGALMLGKPIMKQRDESMFDDGWSDTGMDDVMEPCEPLEDTENMAPEPMFESDAPPVSIAPSTAVVRQAISRPVLAPKINPLALLDPHEVTSSSRPVKKGKLFTLSKPRTTKSIFQVNAAFAALYSKTRKQSKTIRTHDEIEELWIEDNREIHADADEPEEQIFNGFDDDLDMGVDDGDMDEPENDLQQLIDDSLPTSQTFESLCRQHLQSFLRGAEEYAKETNLSRRVSDWTSKLEPILAEQEQRPEFDMHSYSDKALTRLSVSTTQSKSGEKEVYFKEIVSGESRYEVCRLFLACLQLGNLGNIAFQEGREVDITSNDLKVKVISDVSNRLNIENYRAPSVASTV